MKYIRHASKQALIISVRSSHYYCSMTSNSVPPEKTLYAEMAQRLTVEDLKDISAFDYPEEREKHLVALKTFQRHLFTGTGDNIHPREALLEFSWKKMTSQNIRQHEKRIFASCFLTLNYCADIEQWLGFDTTVGNLIESVFCVDTDLFQMALPLFIHAEETLDEDEHIIFAKLGSLVCQLANKNHTASKAKFVEIETLEDRIFKQRKKKRMAKIGNFAGLKPPMITEGWHVTRKYIRALNAEIADIDFQRQIKTLCDRLWMPTEHYYWKWNEGKPN